MCHGELPSGLEAVVDDQILEAVPTDPFSGCPLRYARERRIVWSIGPDEEDDGGDRDPVVRWSGEDYVWDIPGEP